MDTLTIVLAAAGLVLAILGMRFLYPPFHRSLANRDQAATIQNLDAALTAEIHARNSRDELHTEMVEQLRAEHAQCREDLVELRARFDAVSKGIVQDLTAQILAEIQLRTRELLTEMRKDT